MEDQEPDVEKRIKSEQASSGDHNMLGKNDSSKEEGLVEDDEEN